MVFNVIAKNVDFVYLYFGNRNIITNAAIETKNAGLSDQTIKAQYLKNFVNNNYNVQDAIKKVVLDQTKLIKYQLAPSPIAIPSATTLSNTTNSIRITDLTFPQFITLLTLLKTQNGRYIDSNLQVLTSNKPSLTYFTPENMTLY